MCAARKYSEAWRQICTTLNTINRLNNANCSMAELFFRDMDCDLILTMPSTEMRNRSTAMNDPKMLLVTLMPRSWDQNDRTLIVTMTYKRLTVEMNSRTTDMKPTMKSSRCISFFRYSSFSTIICCCCCRCWWWLCLSPYDGDTCIGSYDCWRL